MNIPPYSQIAEQVEALKKRAEVEARNTLRRDMAFGLYVRNLDRFFDESGPRAAFAYVDRFLAEAAKQDEPLPEIPAPTVATNFPSPCAHRKVKRAHGILFCEEEGCGQVVPDPAR